MSDPTHFPAELANCIFDYATHRNRNVNSLINFCLVSHRWNAIAKPRLYATWAFHGEKHSIRLLWRYLCTIIRKRETASLVLLLDVRNWSVQHDDSVLNLYKEVRKEDLVIVQQASEAAGMYCSEENIVDALKEGNRDLFIALIFAHLPNASAIRAQTPAYDGFLGPLLSGALSDRRGKPRIQAFQKLQEITLLSEWARPNGKRVRSSPKSNQSKVDLDYLFPILSLPKLERLSIFGLEIEGIQRHCQQRAATSAIRHLTLVNKKGSIFNSEDMQAIIVIPKALISLSLSQIYTSLLCVSIFAPKPINNIEVFSALQQHRGSLEYLDVYREYVGCRPPAHHKDTTHFGSLREFKHLKELHIQAEALLGENPWESSAVLQLKDVLPTSLESLTLYGDDTQTVGQSIELQFREVLSSGDFPKLRSIVLDKVLDLNTRNNG